MLLLFHNLPANEYFIQSPSTINKVSTRFHTSVRKRPGTRTASLSASISHAIESVESSRLMNPIGDSIMNPHEEEKDLYRCNGSVTASQKSEEEMDDGSLIPSLTTGRHRGVTCRNSMEEEEADVEARVQEALRLLGDDGDGDSEEELENREWRTRASAGHYMAFGNEVVGENWMLGGQEEPFRTYSRSMDGLMGSEKEENREEEVEKEEEESDKKDGKLLQMETNMTGNRDDERQLALKEDWQKAYTAKGHVYYYNRSTRESLWKKYVLLEKGC